MARSTQPNMHSFWLFFPAASLWAATVVPLSIYAALSGYGWPPGLIGAGHGHELIFGFALALIAGYTLGPQPRRALVLLFGLWLAARLAWLLAPETLFAQSLSPAFALLLAWYVVPRFQAAKKWRNKIAGPLILVLCLMALVYFLTQAGLPLPDTRRLLQTTILGLLLLMTFMGGRIIVPAVAGSLEKRGIPLEARVQPYIEGALLVVLPIAMALMLFSATEQLAGVLLLAASALVVTRIVRWKLWHCSNRPDLLVLALGYMWLAIGSAFAGTHLLAGRPVLPALHLIVVGALGTLSGSVMLRLAWQRARRTFPPAWQVIAIAILVAAATISRYLAGATPYSQPELLWFSSGCWALTFAGVAGQVMALYPLTHKPGTARHSHRK
ncbi:NnrS family protein [Marinobacter sp.]|uniref:NnrS family protein n=1 Tax=Marinobacter sp. TaxID=50741 RepID=UPI0025838573|nr:NnrS family protein [Marinobacter sp.]MCW9011260.1 NnrS family protein [Marinobacter sp.]